MSLLRFFEIGIYELVDLIPNLILALLPFRDSLRFPKKQVSIYILLLYIFLTLSRILALNSLSVAACLSVLWVVFYFIFYIIVVKSQPAKLFFVLLTILNYCSFIVIIFSHIAYHRFSQIVNRPYSLLSSILLAFVYLITYPFIYKMLIKMRILISFPENNRYWRFLWMVPATFCLSYYYNLYTNGGIILFSKKLNNVLFAIFFNLGALFVTYLVMHLLDESNTNLELKSENYQLNMQFIQYENLKERIEEARRAKHDLRQSLTVIQACVQNDDKENLLNYLEKYITSLPSDSPLVFCENYAINALIVYYSDLADRHGISFETDIQYPCKTYISDTDAVVLLGNLLENALEACLRQTSGKTFITLHIKQLQGMLVITLDNSYSGMVSKEGEDFISSKTNRKGTGTSSVRKIAAKYQGILKFHYEDNQFHVSVMIHL